jgi:hypothetical protein
MPFCSAAGLIFRIIPQGLISPLGFVTGFTVIMPTLFKIKQDEEQKKGKLRNAKDNQQPPHRHEQKTNFLIALPRDLANSGSFWGPKTNKTITEMIKRSRPESVDPPFSLESSKRDHSSH